MELIAEGEVAYFYVCMTCKGIPSCESQLPANIGMRAGPDW